MKGTVCKNQKSLLTATPVAVKSTKVSVGLALVLALNRHERASLKTERRLTSAKNHIITLYFSCLAVMLVDQTRVSPWITADPSVGFAASASRPQPEGTGDTGVLVGDDNVSRRGAPSLHKTRETSVGLEELQQLFLHKRPLYIH